MTELTKLQQRVIEQLGCDGLDIEAAEVLKGVMECSAGAAGGFTGFIYYSETCKFFDDNKKVIMDQLIEDRASIGYDSLTEMLHSFNCFKDIDTYNIEQFLIDPEDEENEEQTTLKNGLSWYALEVVAFQLEDEITNLIEEYQEQEQA